MRQLSAKIRSGRPSAESLGAIGFHLAMAIIVLAGGHYNQVGWAIAALVIVELYYLQIRTDGWRARAISSSPFWLVGIAGVVVVALTPKPVSQLLIAASYGVWRIWMRKFQDDIKYSFLVAAVTQFMALWAIFLAAAVWHLPGFFIVALTWFCSWLVAARTLSGFDERAARALAVTWALIAAECAWIFSLWLVNYILFEGVLVIPQPALVLTALGYCLAGIYSSHRRSQLSRTRLIEYLVVGLIVMGIVIVGTKWNGGI